MDNNNIVSAPQLGRVSRYYGRWKQNHTGSLLNFVDFMTEPSTERDSFVDSLGPEIMFNGSVAAVTLP